MVISANTKTKKTVFMVAVCGARIRQNQPNNSAKNGSFIAGAFFRRVWSGTGQQGTIPDSAGPTKNPPA
jgi:hypothetical protein